MMQSRSSSVRAGVAWDGGDEVDVTLHRPVRQGGQLDLVDAVRKCLAALAALAEAALPTGGREASRGVEGRLRLEDPPP